MLRSRFLISKPNILNLTTDPVGFHTPSLLHSIGQYPCLKKTTKKTKKNKKKKNTPTNM